MRMLMVLLAVLLAAPAWGSPPPMVLRLDNGTPLIVTPTADISSATSQTGDAVTFTVAHDCKVDGQLLVSAGTVVQGTVTEAVHSKMFGKPGVLQVAFWTTSSVDGAPLAVRASMQPADGGIDARGNQDKKGAANLATFLPYGIGLVFNGKDAVLKAGTPLTIFVDEDVDFQIPVSGGPRRISPAKKSLPTD